MIRRQVTLGLLFERVLGVRTLFGQRLVWGNSTQALANVRLGQMVYEGYVRALA